MLGGYLVALKAAMTVVMLADSLVAVLVSKRAGLTAVLWAECSVDWKVVCWAEKMVEMLDSSMVALWVASTVVMLVGL